eukprot:jgi/Mesvir1/10280/Mv26435-RA.2
MAKSVALVACPSVPRITNCLLPTAPFERQTSRPSPPLRLPGHDVARIIIPETRDSYHRKSKRAISLIQLRQNYPTCLSQPPSYAAETGSGGESPLWRRMPPNPAAPDTSRLGRRQGPPVDIDDDNDVDESRWEERWRARHDTAADGAGVGDFEGKGRRSSSSSSSSVSWERSKKPRKRASLSVDHREKISAALKGQRVGRVTGL